MNRNLFVLKLKLMQAGVSISPILMQRLKNFLYNDYVTCSGIMLKLGANHYDSKNINLKAQYMFEREYITAHITPSSDYIFDINKSGNFVITNKKGEIQIDDVGISRPMLNQNEDSPVAVHGDRIRVSLVTGCSGDCKFCGLNKLKYRVNSFQTLKKEIDHMLLFKKDVKRLFLTGGNPIEQDLPKITNIISKLVNEYSGKGIKNFDFMFAPRGVDKYFYTNNIEKHYEKFLLKLKQIGITTIAIDLEMYNKELLLKYAPFKSKIGVDNYMKALRIGVKVFGEGNVRSNIIVGLEPISDSIKAVDELTEIKVQPCLSPYEPYKFLPEIKKPSFSLLYNVFNEAEKICESKNVKMAPSIYASDTHNSVASAQSISPTMSELNSFFCNINAIEKSIINEGKKS